VAQAVFFNFFLTIIYDYLTSKKAFIGTMFAASWFLSEKG